jgi:spore maturation protein SpmA
MNAIFFVMIAFAFLAAAWRQALWTPPTPEQIETGRQAAEATGVAWVEPIAPMQELTNGALASAATAVEIAISLIGGMALFLGVMKVAEAGGMMKLIARAIRPVMILLFPDVPPDHPAMGAMILNISANALGLGNAATPFGIRAMQDLDTLNPAKGTATNAMALFLAINTSAVTLLPTGVMVIRERLGSVDPGGIFGTTLIATVCSTIAGITAAKVFQRFASPMPPPVLEAAPAPDQAPDAADLESTLAREGLPPESVAFGAPFRWDPGTILHLAVLFSSLALLVLAALFWGRQIAPWVIPGLIAGMLTFGVVRGVRVYEELVEGAKEGFKIAVLIIPYLVAILVAVGMLRASGALDVIIAILGPFTELIGLPADALFMALVRPLSGSGASGVMIDAMNEHGPDSLIGYLVSTFQGSTETTFYVLAVYFGAVQVHRIRHTLAAALTADVVGILAAVAAVHWYMSGL